CPSFAAAPTQLDPTTKRICVKTRSKRPSGFLRDSLCSLTLRSPRSSEMCITEGSSAVEALVSNASALGTSAATTLQWLSDCRSNVRLRVSFRRRRFVAKFAVPNFAAGVSNIPAASQSACAEQNYREHEWHR